MLQFTAELLWKEASEFMKEIERITEESFKPYGTLIEFPADETGDFYIAETEEEQPWRIAVFRYRNRSIQTIERHPLSKESFEPLKGTTLLLTAEPSTPEDYHVFLLDRPVCLNKNVWHQVMALSQEAQVKITENLQVESVFYKLPGEIRPLIG